ncbi:MAG: alpha/beta hydrolase [Bacteroidetes bacterium]|nr:alpha/beta hydrolase [Bacteroidota bacterium]
MPLFIYNNSQIQYHLFGKGNILVVAFHGYGKDAQSFKIWENKLDSATFLSISLFEHGESKWNESRKFSKDDFINIISELIRFLGLQKKPIVPLGYSIGARYAIALSIFFPQNILGCIVLAPDGFSTVDMVRLSSKISFLKRIIIRYPGIVLHALTLGYYFNLFSRSAMNFFKSKFDTEAKRIMLFNVWKHADAISVKRLVVADFFNSHKLPFFCVIGIHDEIIHPGKLYSIKKQIKNMQVIEVDEGHSLVNNNMANRINGILLQLNSNFFVSSK